MQNQAFFRRSVLTAAVSITLAASGIGAAPISTERAVSESSTQVAEASGKRARYIVGLKAPALGLADAAIPRRASDQRLDVRSPEAIAYVNELRAQQDNFLSRVSTQLGRAVEPFHPDFQFQHAFNGMVIELSASEAELLRANPDVSLLEPEVELPLDTDAGPALIGAPTIWDGSNVPGNLATRGEGVVIGTIDSGLNIASEAFAATDAGGYTHVNPLGAGNYLGWCNPANPNHVAARDVCNSKLIGGWDFADAANAGNTLNFEAPGFEDENGHGTHTSSTSGGNARTVSFNGVPRNVSGVAPHANIIHYDVCHTVVSSGLGSCFNTATLAAINQVLADGIVDVVNYSISGGAQPWLEANSLAFLALNNAGVYVSASAGNSGPVAGSVAHVEPWVTTVANSTHTRVFGFGFSLGGPGTPPANTQNLTVRPGGAPIATSTLTAPIIISPNFANGATDGCSAYPANFFRRPADAGGVQGLAVLRLDGTTSQCASGARRTAALAAGAIGVLFIDGPPLSLGASGTSYSMLLSSWNDVEAHIATDPANATATITVPITASPGVADNMASSSSRGPSIFPLLKPDISAPGSEILAAFTRWVSAAPRPFGGAVDTALNNRANVISGTSMSAPHNAGSAALLRALNRSWTPSQIKSALVTTATTPMRKENGITPADPFDYGGGRVELTRAAKAGLIMDETGANFTAANPANGGNPGTLNLPSFQNQACITTCTFTRSVRGTRAAAVTWTASVTGLPAGAGSVSPASFVATSASTTNFTLSVNSAQLPANTWSFGTVVLTPSNPAIPVSRMSIAVRPAPPAISFSASSLSASAAPGTTANVAFTVNSPGNPTLNWSAPTGSQATSLLSQPVALGNGFQSAAYTTTVTNSRYVADDFTLPAAGTVTTLRADGFTLPSGTLLSQVATATAVNFAIYADNAGVPAGYPAPDGSQTGAIGAAPLFVFTGSPTGTGVNVANNNISVDLVAAGATPPNLPAGKYWVVVYPKMAGNGSNTAGNPIWAWRINGVGAPTTGDAPLTINPNTVGATWAIPTLAAAPGPGPVSGFTLFVNGTVTCGAPWLSINPTSGALGNSASSKTQVSFNATGLAVGTYTAALCIAANDPDRPLTVIPVRFTVVSDPLFSNGFENPVR